MILDLELYQNWVFGTMYNVVSQMFDIDVNIFMW